MLDERYEPDKRGEGTRDANKPDGGAPLSDREVPLAPVATFDHIHRWLDGEAPEPSGVRGDSARSVEFWRRLEEESERRRRVVTPPYVAARIMASLPDARSATMTVPWWKKDVHLSPGMAVVIAVTVFSLGLIVMRVIAGS
jgi:hypothetical protein